MSSNLKNTPFGNFVWFIGVVEDINDPEQITRVRVRALGFHSEDKNDIATEDLPWAPVLNGPANMSAPMFVPSDWVIGFFLDGEQAQQPIVFGRIDGIPQERRPSSLGFSDPSDFYPRNLGEGTNSRLARGLFTNISRAADRSRVTGIPSANKSKWDEPSSPFAAVYPQNKVLETDAGNVIEMDDTQGAERIRILHTTGSFIEIHPDGKTVYRATNERYDVTFDNHNIFVKGSVNITAKDQVNIVAGGDMNISTKGNLNWRVGGNFTVESGGTSKIISGGTNFIQGSQVQLNQGISASLGSPADVPDFQDPGDAVLIQRPGARIAQSPTGETISPVKERPPTETPADLPTEQPKTTGTTDGEDQMIKAMNRAGITDECTRAQIMAQTAHESGNFKFRTENLNYSAEGLKRTWPNRFNDSNVSQYARNPEAIANKTYGGRMGNGPEASGDGWKYRGRGFIQLTGKDNYIAASRGLGVDFVNNPDAVAQDPYAADLAVWYTTKFRPFRQPCDVVSSTQIVNGGQNGIADRRAKFEKYRNDPKVTKYDPANV